MTIGACAVFVAMASDHGDTPTFNSVQRPDANLTDLHAFVHGDNLVLSLSTNEKIPVNATSYQFPSDLTFEINIDVDAAVSPTDTLGDGGTVMVPDRISADETFRIRFKDDGSAVVQRVHRGPRNWGSLDDATVVLGTSNLRGGPVMVAPRGNFETPGDRRFFSRRTAEPRSATAGERTLVNAGIEGFFAGLRDDPFIRAPRMGKNVGSIVIETPLSSVLRGQSTILIWATVKVEEIEGSQQESVGRSLRSMFPEQNAMNTMEPREQMAQMGMRPDVMIYDTSRPASYPNGRALTDDVVDLACALSAECRVANNDAPNPTANDEPFEAAFPYLAAPHLAQ
jgi:hypothetical protein